MWRWNKVVGVIVAWALLFAVSGAAQNSTKPAKLTIEQLIDIKHPTNALWSPDGKHVVFTWDLAGVSNLYVASTDGHGQPVSLTSFSEGQVNPAFWSRDSQTVYFPHRGDLWQAAIGRGTATPAWTTAARESRSEERRVGK